MADAIKTEFGCNVVLKPGSGGVLDVVANGTLVFSKHQSGYKPAPAEIVQLLNGSGD